jgi:hypothetical protein
LGAIQRQQQSNVTSAPHSRDAPRTGPTNKQPVTDRPALPQPPIRPCCVDSAGCAAVGSPQAPAPTDSVASVRRQIRHQRAHMCRDYRSVRTPHGALPGAVRHYLVPTSPHAVVMWLSVLVVVGGGTQVRSVGSSLHVVDRCHMTDMEFLPIPEGDDLVFESNPEQPFGIGPARPGGLGSAPREIFSMRATPPVNAFAYARLAISPDGTRICAC